MDHVTITRRPHVHEVCILVAGSKRGIFFPVEVLEWLQGEDIRWTVRDDGDTISFTIPDATERLLFTLRFAHLRPA